MGLIIFTSGLLLYFGTMEGVEGCNQGVTYQRMWFFTESWVADCSTVQTWHTFGIISIVVGLIIAIATIIAQFI